VFANGQIMKVAPVLGDFNRDFQITSADLQAMLGALKNPAAYESAYGLTAADMLMIGDINNDGVFNAADIKPFMNLLASSSGLQPVPEPASIFLLVVGLSSAGLLNPLRPKRR